MRRSKLYKSQVSTLEASARYTIKEALDALKAMPAVKFDQTVEAAFRLGIDPRKSDQNVRGAVALPSGTITVTPLSPSVTVVSTLASPSMGWKCLLPQ